MSALASGSVLGMIRDNNFIPHETTTWTDHRPAGRARVEIRHGSGQDRAASSGSEFRGCWG